ncbi:MAG TPA: AAA family ATPase [Ktedonobacterales bacterium]|nr:AAA family ATPase [Ktedonobacterales bacterium]
MSGPNGKLQRKPGHSPWLELEEQDIAVLERQLLANREAEEGLVGGLLVYPDRMDDVTAILRGDEKDLIGAARYVYHAALALWREGAAIDFITVAERMRQMGTLEDNGGLSYVSHLASNAAMPGALEEYARILRRLSERRAHRAQAEYLAREAVHCVNDEAYDIIVRSVGEALTGMGEGIDEALPILTDAEAEALPPLQGILGDILFDESVSYLYGPSGRWKSFVALDWSLSIATGRPWMGRHVVEGDVLYICSEGARGVGKRITAWKQRHGWTGPTRLRVMPVAIDLANASQVSALPRRLEALDIEPRLIVFDTLAASNSGDEKEAVNANVVTAAARRLIRAHPGVCVLIVHHTGYDTTHMRGSTAFYSNADTVIRIEGGEANRRIEPGEPITIVSDKPKEGEPFRDITLTADVETWASEDGAAIHSSLVMIPGEAAKAAKARDRELSPQRKAALAALESAGPDGLGASAWHKASGMSHGAFYDAIKFFVNAQLVSIGAGGNYYCSPAGPVGPVRSGFGPAGPTMS